MEAAVRVSVPKLHSVRWKNGGCLRVLKTPNTDLRDKLDWALRCAINPDVAVAGFAVVAWSADNASLAFMQVGDASKIPSALVPDFVRNRLLAERIESWTLEKIGRGD